MFPSSEHAYMAAKTKRLGRAMAAILAAADPAEAQRIGRAAPLIDVPPQASLLG
ncbi:hypothetical protein [Mycobacterium marinum]|uniref:hypothetical protein n=1 Tax=Mycobacterium marinum TaxID=1781 RepID=UPI000B00DCA9|nr:hypothetical protein [Mycobacterium marinum]